MQLFHFCFFLFSIFESTNAGVVETTQELRTNKPKQCLQITNTNYNFFIVLSLIQPLMYLGHTHCGQYSGCSYLSVVFLILLKHLNDQLSQANSVLQFFSRGDQSSYVL